MVLDKRITAEQIGPNGTSFLAAWLFFQIAANHIFLPILVITFLFSKAAHRHFSVINLCVSFIVSGIVSSLLFYVGREHGIDPSDGLCVAQASLMSGVPLMTTTSLLTLSWYVSTTLSCYKERPRPFLFNPFLIGLPYLAFGLFSAIGVGLALQHSDRVSREQKFFYCSLHWPAFTVAVAVICTLVCLAAVFIEARIWRLLYRNWSSAREEVDLDIVVRTSIFTFYFFVSTVVNLAAIWAPGLQRSAAPDMLSGSVPMVLFLVFVSHPTVVRSWAFWKRYPTPRPTPQSKVPNRTSSFVQMPTLENGQDHSSHSSHTMYHTGAPTKEYYDSVPPLPNNGVTIIGKPQEAFGGYMKEKGRVEELRQYNAMPRESSITTLDYSDPERISRMTHV